MIETNALNSVMQKMNERLDKELYGAWRAGYDYLHVYDENPLSSVGLGQVSIEDTVTFTRYYYPSDSNEPKRLEHDGIVHTETYDFTTMPDDIIKKSKLGKS